MTFRAASTRACTMCQPCLHDESPMHRPLIGNSPGTQAGRGRCSCGTVPVEVHQRWTVTHMAFDASMIWREWTCRRMDGHACGLAHDDGVVRGCKQRDGNVKHLCKATLRRRLQQTAAGRAVTHRWLMSMHQVAHHLAITQRRVHGSRANRLTASPFSLAFARLLYTQPAGFKSSLVVFSRPALEFRAEEVHHSAPNPPSLHMCVVLEHVRLDIAQAVTQNIIIS